MLQTVQAMVNSNKWATGAKVNHDPKLGQWAEFQILLIPEKFWALSIYTRASCHFKITFAGQWSISQDHHLKNWLSVFSTVFSALDYSLFVSENENHLSLRTSPCFTLCASCATIRPATFGARNFLGLQVGSRVQTVQREGVWLPNRPKASSNSCRMSVCWFPERLLMPCNSGPVVQLPKMSRPMLVQLLPLSLQPHHQEQAHIFKIMSVNVQVGDLKWWTTSEVRLGHQKLFPTVCLPG
jgi:hypothetical protein